jgi:hypothetical protein
VCNSRCVLQGHMFGGLHTLQVDFQ